jgi:hypothetical protein
MAFAGWLGYNSRLSCTGKEFTSMEIAPLLHTLKDLQIRTDTLRGYL